MTTKEMIAVMQAYEEGKKIQCKYLREEEDCWCDCNIPHWNWHVFYYRVKPEEEKPKRMTKRQLAEWLAKGFGECAFNMVVCFQWDYDMGEENTLVNKDVLIRPWGSDDWVEPTVDIYERDCKVE